MLKGTPHKQNRDLTMEITIKRNDFSDYVISSEGNGLGYRIDRVYATDKHNFGRNLTLETALGVVGSLFGKGTDLSVRIGA